MRTKKVKRKKVNRYEYLSVIIIILAFQEA